MRRLRTFGFPAAVCAIPVLAVAQPPTPIADAVSNPLVPSGITQLPVLVNGQRAYAFREKDGANVVHVAGEFMLMVGEEDQQRLTAREAIIWITQRELQHRRYHHLEVMLWNDAEIVEFGGTITTGPALFITFNTWGDLRVEVDDWSVMSSSDSEAYQQGSLVRHAISAGQLPGGEDPTDCRVIDLSAVGREDKGPKPRPVIQVWAGGELTVTEAPEHRRILTVTGGVDLARGVPGTEQYFEVHADSVVVFLPSGREDGGWGGADAGPGTTGEKQTLGGVPVERKPRPKSKDRGPVDRQFLATSLGEVEVEGAYLEGDVVMSQGAHMIRASRLYYDFLDDRAVILDAVVRSLLLDRNIPLYIRAAQIRQLSRTRYSADDAIVTTSEFHTPHYHIGARRVELSNLTPPDTIGAASGIRTGSFRIRHATLNLGGHPVAYWPFLQGNVDTSETALKSARTGYSDDFGVELETNWDLFNLLGYRTPEGFDSTLSLDYFSQRGPAAGVDLEYHRDKYFGLMRSYLMGDDGSDFLGDDRETPSQHDIRGRFLLRHRQYLQDDWQVSLELSFLSDRSFLEEFFEPEFDNDKDQETLLYLKKQRDNWAFTALLQARIMGFLTQTERLPDFGFFVVGQPLGDRVVWHSENRAGLVRLRTDDDTSLNDILTGNVIPDSGTVVRADSRHELEVPVDVGPLRLVPFASIRGTVWDDTPEEGGVGRVFGTYGVRGSTYLWKLYPDSRSSLLDIDGIRHLIKPYFTAWMADTNHDSDELYEFDQTVEQIDEVDGVAVGVRQRWQTRRAEGEKRAIVDVLTHDLEAVAFNDADSRYITNGFASYSRPENSITRNYLNSSVIWRINDRTAILNETNYNLNDGQVDILNVSVAVERSPRLSYLVGYRLIDETQSDLLGFDMNYRLSEKHTLAFREQFDLDAGQTLDFTVALVRKFPRWFGAISFALDEAEDDFGVSMSIWPEGLTQASLGSGRFTGVTNIALLRGE